MSESRAHHDELRNLEDKRRATGLTPAEETRRTELASGGPASPPGGGFDVGAAAAAVRSALSPPPLPPPPAAELTTAWDLGSPPTPEPAVVAMTETAPADVATPAAADDEEMTIETADLIAPTEAAPALVWDARAGPPCDAPPPRVEEGPDPALGEPVDLSALALERTAGPELAAPSQLVPPRARVVLHTAGGGVRRGVIADFDPDADELWVAPSDGAATEPVAADATDAIFFMLEPGQHPPSAAGDAVEVTFRDGRRLKGVSEDHGAGGRGFFVVPSGAHTRTARVWVNRRAVRRIVGVAR